MVVCAEFVLSLALQHKPDMWRGDVHQMTPEFKNQILWMLQQAAAKTDVVVVSDGRGELMRDAIRNVFVESKVAFIELWFLYGRKKSHGADVRNPKRGNAWASSNMETLFVKLP